MKVTETIFVPFDGHVVFRHSSNGRALDTTLDLERIRQARLPACVVALIRAKACYRLSDFMPGSPEPTWTVGREHETVEKIDLLAEHWDPVVRQEGFVTE